MVHPHPDFGGHHADETDALHHYLVSMSLRKLLPIIGLAGCTSAGAPSPADLQWRTALEGDSIRLVLIDRSGTYRIERVTLVGPMGQTASAREMTRQSETGPSSAGYGLGGAYGSRSGGAIGLGVSVPLGSGESGVSRRTTAVVPVPDPEGYRRDPQRWRLDVLMAAPGGEPYHADLPAPAP
jgi:hypothetical protein